MNPPGHDFALNVLASDLLAWRTSSDVLRNRASPQMERSASVGGVRLSLEPTLARHRSLPRTSAAPLCLTCVEDDGDLFIRRKTLTQLVAELGTVSTDDNEPTA
jgi:hypothetical protein